MNNELATVLEILPSEINRAVMGYDKINEIRLRSNRRISVTSQGKNEQCGFITDEKMIRACVAALCGNSLYSHADTIREGYIALKNGFRVGVCGNAVCNDGKIINISEITSINIRVPSRIYNISTSIYEKLATDKFNSSVMIYSPPGLGKTTMLRDLAIKLSGYPACRRVCVIDTRCEIENSDIASCDNIDVLKGYPKAKGIEIATRTMAPQYIICDEIGTYEEALSLLAVQNCGVPIIATAHAATYAQLLMRRNIKILHEAKIFSLYVGILSKGEKGRPVLSFYNENSAG